MYFDYRYWVRLAVFNLLIVALIGLVMRYKIGFEFPFFNQKNLQHAHSHFAFSAWISLMIMLLMLYNVRNNISIAQLNSYKNIFYANIIVAFGMLVSFIIEGYAVFSITFSTLSIFVSFWFCFKFYNDCNTLKMLPGLKWLNMAMLFNVLSTMGTFSLSYMMATKQIGQHSYLTSVYWYLHFQYNGWFFFACVGLFINYLNDKGIRLVSESSVFRLFTLACIPAYGLSVLWLNLPIWVYVIVILAAVMQTYGIFIFLREIISQRLIGKLNLNLVSKLLLFCVIVSVCSKILLQLGSTVPEVSKFAYGFRPIVIAYLHLVLLAFISVFLIAYAYYNGLIGDSRRIRMGLIMLLVGILVNELLLGLQGVFSMTYTMVPYANEMLFAVSLMIFLSLIVLNISLLKKKV